jgi:cell fate regulator YaaT (PSP1 superfamily)
MKLIIMSNESVTDIDNPFFTRGCCFVPEGSEAGRSFRPSCAKLDAYNWLKEIELAPDENRLDIVEVRFKNSKKEFFRASAGMNLKEGDIVAVESSPGHDIGIVSLSGELVKFQMKKKKSRTPVDEMKKVYRRARYSDVDKWITAVKLEQEAIFKTRKAASDLHLDMKINDVEYQGDGTKAIFYYTADERVDFRQLIRVLAEKFKVRIEMKQIGARQEAARLGGIGSCGRELCCATWMTNFSSVSTNNARTQQLSLNPSKLAGQCGKLKCCLNYENATYLEALKEFPESDLKLKTKKGMAEYQKADVFKRCIWYSYMGDYSSMMAIPLDKVKEIIRLNEKGKLPEKLEDFAETMEQKTEYENGQENDNFYRFDKDEIY